MTLRAQARYYIKPRSLAFGVGVLKIVAGLVMMLAAILPPLYAPSVLLESWFGSAPFDVLLTGIEIVAFRAAIGGKVPKWL